MGDPRYNQNEQEIGVIVDSISRNLKAAGLGLVKLSEAIRPPPLRAAQAKSLLPPEGSDD